MKNTYTKPLLVKAAKGWFVRYTVNGKEKREKMKLNYIKDLVEREKEFNALRDEIERSLKSGFTFGVSLPAYAVDDSLARSMTLAKALDFALEKKKPKISRTTYLNYKCTIDFCKTAIRKLHYQQLPIIETKRIHIKNVMECIKDEREWSAIAYNKNLGYLQGVMSELLKWYIIESNPAHQQETYAPDDKEPTRTPTPKEYSLIKRTLKAAHFDYYRYVLTLFHTGIRPEELTAVKISDVNMELREIKLKPLNTKTKKFRTVAMTLELFEFFEKMELDQHPQSFFLFGTFKTSQQRYLPHVKEFIPAPHKITRSRATRLWKQLIKDGLGLDIDLYAGKHAGANAMLAAGISKEAIKKKFGHASMFSTDIYLTDLNGILLDEIKRSDIRFDED